VDDAGALLDRVAAGDRRALARALTRAEAGDAPLRAELAKRRAPLVGPRRVGFTGPPGAGKSSLVNALVRAARARGETVAVLAVDPSSPFGGGAFLGDRIRLNEHALDAGVFVRSQASRGAAGGLAETSPDLMDVFALSTFDRIFVETVGVGQSELEVARLTDFVVVVLSPHAGDVMQAMKSGLIEIGDRFVVNKADLPGAEAAKNDLIAGLELAAGGAEKAERVDLVSASSGAGVAELLAKLDAATADETARRRDLALERRLDAGVARGLAFLRLCAAFVPTFQAELAAVREGRTTLEDARWRLVAEAINVARREGPPEHTP
jgi:LAO/AO transport system kinase